MVAKNSWKATAPARNGHSSSANDVATARASRTNALTDLRMRRRSSAPASPAPSSRTCRLVVALGLALGVGLGVALGVAFRCRTWRRSSCPSCSCCPIELFSPGRLSVLYQPEPLKTIAGIDRRRRGFLPQLGHFSQRLVVERLDRREHVAAVVAAIVVDRHCWISSPKVSGGAIAVDERAASRRRRLFGENAQAYLFLLPAVALLASVQDPPGVLRDLHLALPVGHHPGRVPRTRQLRRHPLGEHDARAGVLAVALDDVHLRGHHAAHRDGSRARRRVRAVPEARRTRHLSHDLLPALRDVDGRGRARVHLDLPPAVRTREPAARRLRHHRTAVVPGTGRRLPDARQHARRRTAGLGRRAEPRARRCRDLLDLALPRVPDPDLPRRAREHPARVLRSREARRRQPVAALHAGSRCRCCRRRSSSSSPSGASACCARSTRSSS